MNVFERFKIAKRKPETKFDRVGSKERLTEIPFLLWFLKVTNENSSIDSLIQAGFFWTYRKKLKKFSIKNKADVSKTQCFPTLNQFFLLIKVHNLIDLALEFVQAKVFILT